MRTTSKLLALALAAALQPALAGTVELKFEDLAAAASPVSLDGVGYHGVDISGAAWGIVSSTVACGGNADFIRDDSCGALELADFSSNAPEQSLKLSISGGFEALSFVYSGKSGSSLAAYVFDADGNYLAWVESLAGSGCGSNYTWCDWSGTITLDNFFDGALASYVVFTGTNRSFLLDDIVFTTPQSTTPPGQLPEPTSVALALGALGALGWTRKRSNKR